MPNKNYSGSYASQFHAEAVRLPGLDHDYSHSLAAVRVHSAIGMKEPSKPFPRENAMTVVVALNDLQAHDCEVWADGRSYPRQMVFRMNSIVIDMRSNPGCLMQAPFEGIHFRLSRDLLNEVCHDVGLAQVETFRCGSWKHDAFFGMTAQLALRGIRTKESVSVLEADRLSLLMAAHLVQDYSGHSKIVGFRKGGLAPWQKQRSSEFLRAHLDGRITVRAVAAQCNLSASHFARAFKESFGVPVTEWVNKARLQYCQDRMRQPQCSLAEVGAELGFFSQSTFSRWFRRQVGTTPRTWLMEHDVQTVGLDRCRWTDSKQPYSGPLSHCT
jgi:AraC-like DNA-binding protein